MSSYNSRAETTATAAMSALLSTSSGQVPSDLRTTYAKHGQDQVFEYVDSGVVQAADETDALVAQLRTIDLSRLHDLHKSTNTIAPSAKEETLEEMKPIESFGSLESAPAGDKDRWFKTGLKAVAEGKVAVVVLSGGQGTRLGFSGPKGMYDIGLPSGKTLFQLQAERLLRVCALANNSSVAATTTEGAAAGPATSARIPWYIMTSPLNDATTREFFAAHKFFGVPESDVFFFSQGTLPCMTRDGKIILESAGKVAMAPDGNGGIYPALQQKGALADMGTRGVEHLHVFSIDNALVRVADPYFLGYCVENNADCGNKSVWKSDPDEKVGVVVSRGGKPCVVEYSEMDKETCERRDPATGKLVFGAGNICNHYFSRAFLEDTVLPGMGDMYHVAHKKIPAAHGPSGETRKPSENNGIKLESFIFDVFPLSKKMVLFETSREEEFAPVKNAPGTATDSPDTAREMISEQAKRWARAAGASRPGGEEGGDGGGGGGGKQGLSEISPLVSYGGEGLQDRVAEMEKAVFRLE